MNLYLVSRSDLVLPIHSILDPSPSRPTLEVHPESLPYPSLDPEVPVPTKI